MAALARAQTSRVRQIGILMSGSDGDAEVRAEVLALQNGLHEVGWIEGYDIHFEFRWPRGYQAFLGLHNRAGRPRTRCHRNQRDPGSDRFEASRTRSIPVVSSIWPIQ